jgi:hypothetical protein
MVRSLILIWAAPVAALTSPASGQAPPAPKPISRADFVKRADTQFNTIDANHDGSLSKAELEGAEQRSLQQLNAAREQRIQAQFKQLDTNHDGQLSQQEFAAGAPTLKINETPEQLLQQLDSNHDGKVSADEFRAPQLASFAKADANHDGVVTPDEARAAVARK